MADFTDRRSIWIGINPIVVEELGNVEVKGYKSILEIKNALVIKNESLTDLKKYGENISNIIKCQINARKDIAIEDVKEFWLNKPKKVDNMYIDPEYKVTDYYKYKLFYYFDGEKLNV